MNFEIENFTTAKSSTGYVAWFDCRIAEFGVRFFNLRLIRPEQRPRELWLHLPMRTDCRSPDRPHYQLDAGLRRAIGEAAAARYREHTGVDVLFVAPGEKRSAASGSAAGVRRVLGAVEETMERAGL